MVKHTSAKKIIFIVLFTGVCLPFIQSKWSFVKLIPLTGSFENTQNPVFSWSDWFNGNYQKNYNKYAEENIGFRNFLIRLYNQLDFSFFNVTHSDVVVGKNGQLFQEAYLNAYLGNDFIGEQRIIDQVEKLKFIKSKLKEIGIELVVVFAPTKVRFFPEKIPEYYSRQVPGATNYETYKKILTREQVSYLDFIAYFLLLKDQSPYALYPELGIHWNSYGMFVCADSILKYMEKQKQIDLLNVTYDQVELSALLRDPDNDLVNLANLLFELPHEKMPYPHLIFEKNPMKPRLKMLAIGDSYYWNLYRSGILENIFTQANFWYYNHDVYADSLTGSRILDLTTCLDEIEKQDVILILQTESNLNKLGFGFIDLVYEAYKNNNNPIENYKKMIRNNPDWLKNIRKKAKERNLTVEEMILLDAEWMVSNDLKKSREHESSSNK